VSFGTSITPRVVVAAACAAMVGATLAQEAALHFKPIKSVEDLRRELSGAHGQAVLLHVHGDWAVSSMELLNTTFKDPAVIDALRGVVLLRADITTYTAVDKDLLAHLEIEGAPAVLVYGADGEERRNFRTLGFMKAPEFAAVVRRAVATATTKAQ
jgi:thioredoxin:protein disulfide reductase